MFMAKKKVKCCAGSQSHMWVISEAATYFSIWYVLWLLKVSGNLWVAAAVLLVLINLAILTCPYLKKMCNC